MLTTSCYFDVVCAFVDVSHIQYSYLTGGAKEYQPSC